MARLKMQYNEDGTVRAPMYRRPPDLSLLEPYYTRHISAMTTERLDSKSEIAAELAWRDMKLARVREALRNVRRGHLTNCDFVQSRGHKECDCGADRANAIIDLALRDTE